MMLPNPGQWLPIPGQWLPFPGQTPTISRSNPYHFPSKGFLHFQEISEAVVFRRLIGISDLQSQLCDFPKYIHWCTTYFYDLTFTQALTFTWQIEFESSWKGITILRQYNQTLSTIFQNKLEHFDPGVLHIVALCACAMVRLDQQAPSTWWTSLIAFGAARLQGMKTLGEKENMAWNSHPKSYHWETIPADPDSHRTKDALCPAVRF